MEQHIPLIGCSSKKSCTIALTLLCTAALSITGLKSCSTMAPGSVWTRRLRSLSISCPAPPPTSTRSGTSSLRASKSCIVGNISVQGVFEVAYAVMTAWKIAMSAGRCLSSSKRERPRM